MEANRSAKKKILRKAYGRLAIVNMVVLMATTICSFIDNVVISNFLGAKALAAVGYFSPISAITGLVFVLIIGTSVLCGNYIGGGEQKRVNLLFTSVFKIITVCYTFFSFLLIAFRNPISTLLGAEGDAGIMLSGYIAGFAPSIVFSSLLSLLVATSSFNNEINRSYVSTAAMFFGNLILDLLLAKPLGVIGVGLASSVSSLISFLIILPGYINKSATIHFEIKAFDTKEVLEAARRGLPCMLFTAGMLIKNSLLNYTMKSCAGDDGVAVVNVLGSMCGILGTIGGGFTNSEATLLSLSYGEEDRDGYMDIFSMSFWAGVISTFLLAVLMAALSSPLSGIFIKTRTDAYYLCKRMFILGFWFFPLNLFMSLMMNSYKAQGRMKLVNIVTFIEASMTGVFAFITVPRFGADSAWLANIWSDLLSVTIIIISVFVWKKNVKVSVADLLKLSDDFGAKEDEACEYSIGDMADVSMASEAVMKFCKSKNVSGKSALWASLCVEEVTKNILQHGINKKQGQIGVRIVCRDELTIRVFDDCRKFDPRNHINLFNRETPEKAIGLRMVAGLATYMDYYNNAGINTLILKF